MKNTFEPSDKPEGRYTELEEITSGGMGILYKAYDTILDKPIAIKTLILDSKKETAVTRFQQEAKVVSKLNHPNIVSILDFGLSREEEPYMVMDFIVGKSLEELIEEKGNFKAAEIVDTTLQIARGLAHAHEKGIVHRDIKPSNILVSDQDIEEQRVKIVDFGIAKISDTDSPAGFRTSGEVLKGSPFYISPEQVKGMPTDARSDIYSLGCVMYKMACGQPPFEYDTAIETMKAHAEETPAYPVVRDDNELVASNVARIIYKCLSKNPDDRFENMQELFKELSVVDVPFEESESADRSEKRSFVSLFGLLKFAIVLVGVFAGGYLLYSQLIFIPQNEDASAGELNRGPTKVVSKVEMEKKSMDKFDFYPDKGEWVSVNATDIHNNDLKFFESKPGVRAVILEGTSISNEGLRHLVGCGVAAINLSKIDGIDDGAAKYLKEMKNLAALNLSDTKFGDAGLIELDNPHLRLLTLVDCPNLTDKGFLTIVEKWPFLENLDVSKNKVSEAALEKIGELKNLEKISVCDIGLTDATIKKLAEIGKVRILNVTGSKISFEKLDKIAQIPSLEILEVTEWILDTAWAERTRIKRPDLKLTAWNRVDDKKVPEKNEIIKYYFDFEDSHKR